mgnify:CR=1 FL=1
MKHSNGIFYHEKHDTKTRQWVSTDAIRAERSEQEVPAAAFQSASHFTIASLPDHDDIRNSSQSPFTDGDVLPELDLQGAMSVSLCVAGVLPCIEPPFLHAGKRLVQTISNKAINFRTAALSLTAVFHAS